MAKFRKKYNKKEAENLLENTYQMLFTNLECLNYWKTGKRSKADKLIEALCSQSREEMIIDVEKKINYCYEKIEYLKQFSPEYQIKGSFGFI